MHLLPTLLVLLLIAPPATQPAAELLAELLPRELAGSPQQHCAARTFDGFNFATASYYNEGAPAHVMLIVTLYPDAETAAGANPWFVQDVNNKSNGQTQRTATIADRRSFEQHEASKRAGRIAIRLTDRSVLLMIYEGFDEAEALTAAETFPLKELGGIK